MVNLFALLYLTSVLHLPPAVTDPMYGALIVLSVPMPLVAGWLSDRVGRRPVIIGVYLGGAIAFAVFLLVGSSLPGLWIAIVLMGLFTFAESPQLQALLADVAPPQVRDASFSLYFTLAFGVGSTWTFLYGLLIDPNALGVERGHRGGRHRCLCYHSPALHNGHSVGAWRSLVARVVRDDKVVGSNPAAPTIRSSGQPAGSSQAALSGRPDREA